ncbi:MAG: leucine-rich repeat domain-containing protein [Muribaculaceae bacterium]|nr:leucine-rich repeat domain-containing protein [Muribaculaceae bacterium]
MKKRILSALTAAAATIVSASAFDVKIDNIYYNIINGEYLEVTAIIDYPICIGDQFGVAPMNQTERTPNDYSGDIVIPDSVSVDGYEKKLPVKTIRTSAFLNAQNLISVTLPETITDVGWSAFAQSSIKKLDMSKAKLQNIRSWTCYWCEDLVEVTIPDGIEYIGEGAFMLSGITEITIPDSTESIDGQAFVFCRKLTTIHGGKNVTEYGYASFSTTNISTVVIHEVVRKLSDAFSHNANLKNVICHKSDPDDFDGYFSFHNSNPNCTLWVPDESLELYKASSQWTSFFKDIRPMSQLGLSQTAAPYSENIRYFNMTGRQVDEPTPGHLYITSDGRKIQF